MPSRLHAPYALVTLLVCGTLASAPAAAAQTGTVTGRVADDSDRPLAGAMVRTLDGRLDASAGRDGRFVIAHVPVGETKVIVRYLGFQPETLTVTVIAARATHVEAVLSRPLAQLETIRIESQLAGQAAAVNQQRAADNISSIVDAELMGRQPDRNLAEALGRVPGVALVRDQGEGRFVQIRGTNASLNTLSINGMRMPSPEPGTRQTPMDVIASDLISAIQVSKTLTPDMDADAIGGNVNLITPTPRGGAPTFALNLAGGQNQINNGLLKNFSGQAGRRLGPQDRFGILVGGSYYQNDRGSQNYEMGWCVETSCTGVPDEQALDVPTNIALRDYSQILRTRQGFNAMLDYRIGADHTVYLKVFASQFSDDEHRFVTNATFDNGTYSAIGADTGVVTGGRMDKELRLRPVRQRQRAAQLGGRAVLGGGTAIDYTLQRARAEEHRPNSLTMVFRQGGMSYRYDVSDQDRPRYVVTGGSPLNASLFNHNSLRRQTRDVMDDEDAGRLDVTHPLRIAGRVASLKVGLAMRMKDRSSLDTSMRLLTTYRAGFATPTLPVTLAALQGPPRMTKFLDGRFIFGPQASPRLVGDFYETYRLAFNEDTARSTVESNQGSYGIKEDVHAGYAMTTFDVGPVMLIAGARLEHTRQQLRGNRVLRAGQAVTITPQTSTRSYANVLPSVTAKWERADGFVVRGAVTTSLVRPDFNGLAPRVNVPDGANVVADVGNPQLDPIRAVNLDLMVERYFSAVGFVSFGVFRKNLRDYIYPMQRPATVDDDLGPTVATVLTSTNAEEGTLNGFEVAWQQQFPMLPGILSGLGLNANYTHTTSSTTLPSRAGTKSRLPGQAGNAANLGVFYEVSRVAVRVGWNFADRYLEVVGETAETDVHVESRGQLDISGWVQVSPAARVFVETNNLTNQPLRRYIGRPERSWQPGNEYYRPWGMIGMRITPGAN